jgi:RHS repeat-associated protein
MMMPGREYQAQPSRFGFNGKENDNEVKGFGNQQDYGMRVYDLRLGVFLSVDPISKKYPELSPYQFASRNPIWNVDIDGLEGTNSTSAAISAGVKQYTDDKKSQAKGLAKLFTTWEPYRNLWNYSADWGKAVTGDQAAIHNVNVKTTQVIVAGTNSIVHTTTDPVVFVATMPTRSTNDNIQGLTYYGLNGLEMWLGYKILEGMDDEPSGSPDRRKVKPGQVEKLPNGMRGTWVTEYPESWPANAYQYQEFATGRKPGLTLKVGEANFDDFLDNVLIEVKSTYGGNIINSKTGEFSKWFETSKNGGLEIYNQAVRQIRSANGIKIQWQFQDQRTLDAFKKFLQNRGIKSGIEFILKPKK